MNVQILDCTLRDGGYVNDWRFGEEAIYDIAKELTEAHTGIVELGFLRDEKNVEGRAVWNSIEAASKFIPSEKGNTQYAIMGEIFNPYPLEKIPEHKEGYVDIIRIIVWKRLILEGHEYCKELVKKGYKVCIQPDRVNQYTHSEFQELIKTFSDINPYAIYVVDSNGFLCKKEIIEYLKAADEVMPANIKLGYHGHNSILQAEGAAEAFVELGLDRDIIIDCSVYGIGRSSGNLNTEIFTKYLNEQCGKEYGLINYLRIFERYVLPFYKVNPWGYCMESYLSSLYRCNPNYGNVLKKEYGCSLEEISDVILHLSEEDKVITNRGILPSLVERIRNKASI